MTYNLAQLATYKQAEALSLYLGTQVGGGVLPGTDEDPNAHWPPPGPGTYRPVWTEAPWSEEPHYTDPITGDKYFYLHYRYYNGAEGMNVGLMLDKYKRYPASPQYVTSELAKEAAAMAPK